MAEPTASPGAPNTIGRYELLGRLAVGGMGEVFLARQVGPHGFDREVVVKTLLPEVAAQPSSVEQFLDEARLAARLNHPNIVSIHEVGSEKGRYYLVMEHIDGPPLSKLLRHKVTPAFAARVVRDAAMGLDHAHRATDAQGRRLELIHRDVSPHNLMLRRDGVLKIVDFGIAKARGNLGRTVTGEVKGKLAYIAPEQLRNERLDQSADQYALGVVFWELLARRRLFDGENDAAVIHQISEHVVPPPSSIQKSVPEALEAICMRMLQRNPRDRYPSMTDVVERLDAQPLATLQEVADEVAAVPAPKAKLATDNFSLTLKHEAVTDPHRAATPFAAEKLAPAGPPPKVRPVLYGGALLAAVGVGWLLHSPSPPVAAVAQAAPPPIVAVAPPVPVAEPPVEAPAPPAAEPDWFVTARPHCNPIESRSWVSEHPPPATADGIAGTALCLLLGGRPSDARRLLFARPELERPAIAEALFALSVPIADEDASAAVPLLDAVLALQPDHPLALYRLGMTNLANHRDEGRAQLKRFLQVYATQDPMRAGAQAALKR